MKRGFVGGVASAAILMMLAAVSVALTVEVPLEGKGSRSGETGLGNLVADAVREAVRAEIAFVPAGALNEVSIPKGEVSEQTLRSVLAFPEDPIVVLSLRGSQILAGLERSVELYPKPSAAFLHVSGIKVVFDPARPRGSRIRSVTINGRPLDPASSYEVAMPISLGRGSLGYFRIWTKEDILRERGPRTDEALIAHATRLGTLSYRPEGRIEASSK